MVQIDNKDKVDWINRLDRGGDGEFRGEKIF